MIKEKLKGLRFIYFYLQAFNIGNITTYMHRKYKCFYSIILITKNQKFKIKAYRVIYEL